MKQALPAGSIENFVDWPGKEKQMRYYLPLHEKNVQGKNHPPSQMIPLWVWMVAIALLILVVLALR